MSAREEIKQLWSRGRIDDALASALRALEDDPDNHEIRVSVVRCLVDGAASGMAGQRDLLLSLVRDPAIEPTNVSPAGWRFLRENSDLFDTPNDSEAMAGRIESDALAIALLEEDAVGDIASERALTALRRWLLVSGRRTDFPKLTAALITQALRNGGAWPFDDEERALLAANPDFAAAYLPPRETIGTAQYSDPVTRSVAQQYEGWPYPQWRRLTSNSPEPIASRIRRYDPEGRAAIPERGATILVAGCGTGRQVVALRQRHPDDVIVAIDISEASLRYAGKRCAETGVHDVEFHKLDLHDVAKLGRSFDVITTTGVLHHLPDPEAGWAALLGVLKPRGVLHVMVYSKIARMRIAALRRMFAGERALPMSDDLLRDIRRKVLALENFPEMRSRDFFTLAGVHDLLMHRHEEPFDTGRIGRALDRFGLALLNFEIPRPKIRAEYRAAHPDDPHQRDLKAIARLELGHPTLYGTMYEFWCARHA
ncbi:MAG: class I SAM-dependent methyltransferase [Proteobacteria bacterium]|nr:class I SAM-dependent methyltransferase [Pseudomonadota bacterium]